MIIEKVNISKLSALNFRKLFFGKCGNIKSFYGVTSIYRDENKQRKESNMGA